ncbi:MAG TPA: hypothetical protein VL633_00605 [Bacteroidota bacterium]|jgi:hypothetical protein|nr:hypothetical protein [Bacteroidota bacterium]
MNDLQDIVGSIAVGGMVLLMLVIFNGNVMESAGMQTFKTTVQGNLTTVTNVIETDFRKMGYRLPSSLDSAIVYADSNRIKFKTDIDNNGTVDTVQYYIDTIKASLTPNPRDFVLHRIQNNQGQSMMIGITRFKLQYFDASDSLLTSNPVTATGRIKSIKLSINMESTDRILDNRRGGQLGNPMNDTSYVGAYWERTIKPKNLR